MSKEKELMASEIEKAALSECSILMGDLNINFIEKEENVLIIEAENKKLSKFYHKQLNADQLTKTTMSLISTPREFIEAFDYFQMDRSSNVKFGILNEATLYIIIDLSLGTKNILKSIEIELEELNMRPMEVCERYLSQLPKLKNAPLSPVEDSMIKMFHYLKKHFSETQKTIDNLNERIALAEKE